MSYYLIHYCYVLKFILERIIPKDEENGTLKAFGFYYLTHSRLESISSDNDKKNSYLLVTCEFY